MTAGGEIRIFGKTELPVLTLDPRIMQYSSLEEIGNRDSGKNEFLLVEGTNRRSSPERVKPSNIQQILESGLMLFGGFTVTMATSLAVGNTVKKEDRYWYGVVLGGGIIVTVWTVLEHLRLINAEPSKK